MKAIDINGTGTKGPHTTRRGVTGPARLLGTGLPGLVLAGMTAVVSGVAIFLNTSGVHAVRSPALYTTAKNLVAAVVLLALALAVGRRPAWLATPDSAHRSEPAAQKTARAKAADAASAVYIGVVGGGVAFVLFFTGLAHTTAQPAAFLHDTLVVWVAVLALPLLGERLSPWNAAAIVVLVAGQVAVTGGIGHLVAGYGQALVLLATVLWSVETVVMKRLLRSGTAPPALAVLRMGVGVVVLLVYLATKGQLHALVHLDRGQIGWVLLTGALLAAYVTTWVLALARARAVDVTSVLVGSVVVTTLLDGAVHGKDLSGAVVGLVLVAAGVAAVVWRWPRPAVTG
ncbi:MAG TPA: DMT family transporter [Acidimicrobiales bacterium]|nr:DMT family transporter [Acidimicrobiales bacterium]